ncbi:ataxin-7-like protein 1 [Megalops cyprinoides]|uniref:ataxin-7-like protein 1 n=1 Tax=Megalops cyprinoides TaxID=118141 RepID=UPI00186536F5|nr:ataxin-7-like protein 1 [Megalops cyprinoides]XP_036373644.1 ataxin-7-like protein 1 [Megalops cyprinoides]
MHSRNQKRHGSPCDSRSPVVQMRNKVSLAHSTISTPLSKPFRVPRDNGHSPFGRAPHAVYPPKGARGKPCVSVPVVSLEKMPALGRTEGANMRVNCTSATSSSFSSSPAALAKSSHKSHERIPNGTGPSTPPSPQDRRPSASPSPLDRRPSSSPSPSPSSRASAPPSPLDRKHQNGTKGSKSYKRLSGRVFDPNKHCGVVDPESRRPCTRSLTCKTHSLTHRRAVPGRRKQFDSLLAEHKGRAKEKEREKEARQIREQQGGRDPHHSRPAPSHDPANGVAAGCHNGKTTSPLKSRLANTYIPRPPGGGGQRSCPGPAPDITPLFLGAEGGGRLSSDEGEAEVPEESERPDCHCSPHHPRPLGCCVFGSRLMGRGHYVFDRRWDRMRLALHCMVEKHVTAQLWRKIPLAAESPAPSPGMTPDLQPFSVPSSIYLSQSPTSAYVMTPPLLSSPTFATRSDGVSVVSYSTGFPSSGGGVFSIVDTSLMTPVPALSPVSSQGKRPRAKPSKPPKVREQASGTPGGAVGGAAGGKKRKPPLSSFTSYTAPHRGNSTSTTPPLTSHLAGPAFSSNGTSPLCAKTEPSGRIVLGPADAARYARADLTVAHPLPGDHALSVHSPLPFSQVDGKKRKSSNPNGKPSKSTKASGLSSIYRKGGAGSESSHTPLPRQPMVHH